MLTENAGIILLHPFFESFLEELGLTAQDQFINTASRHKAVYALYFLATGNEEYDDSKAGLSKLLCGIELTLQLVGPFATDEKLKQESTHLLMTVIEYWKALKNTSAEELRKCFLNRSGLLEKKGKDWKLIVQRSGMDILLQHLPWAVSVVSLPFNEEILFVEWA